VRCAFGRAPAGLVGAVAVVIAALSVAAAAPAKNTRHARATSDVATTSDAVVNTAAPSIYGTATDAQTLTASTGGWTGTAPLSYGYQWQDCDPTGANCSDIADPTASSYTLIPGDDGSTVRVVVTASNAAGSTAASSSPTAVVTEAQATVASPSLAQYDSALTSDAPAATPELTPASTTTASRIAGSDSRLAAIVAAANTNIGAVMPSASMNSWTNMDGSKLLGASVYVPLPAPATITTDWPMMRYDPQELTTPPYTTGTVHFTASNVKGLLVTIDLTRNVVVDIEPDPGATISNLPPNFPATPQPGGES
jgi:hypothetical protein